VILDLLHAPQPIIPVRLNQVLPEHEFVVFSFITNCQLSIFRRRKPMATKKSQSPTRAAKKSTPKKSAVKKPTAKTSKPKPGTPKKNAVKKPASKASKPKPSTPKKVTPKKGTLPKSTPKKRTPQKGETPVGAGAPLDITSNTDDKGGLDATKGGSDASN
jgi:hypothetical protein